MNSPTASQLNPARATAVAVLAIALAQTTKAHHGFGTFDMNADIEISGVVTELAFVNPHSWLYLDVTTADGETVPFRCEMRSATTLRRSGWTPDLFPVGSRITINGSPDRNDAQACYVSTVTFADGSSIDRYGQRTPPVEAASDGRSPRLADGTPNLAGEWAAEQLVMSDPRGVFGSLVPLSQAAGEAQDDAGDDANRRAGVPLIAPEAASRLFIGSVELTAAGRAAAERAQADVNPAWRCEPISILMDWSYDAPVNRITQTADTIVLEYGKFDYARTIHLDRDAHPADLEPSLTGHSIGHWDGDVLVVDTIGLREGPLTRNVFN
ncbi:MAG: DUF6152 family protein, partial [Gammaproteobacteria bacterium]|nr:DUF6152 family protein [Gammaproteobacteria bacterium]